MLAWLGLGALTRSHLKTFGDKRCTVEVTRVLQELCMVVHLVSPALDGQTSSNKLELTLGMTVHSTR